MNRVAVAGGPAGRTLRAVRAWWGGHALAQLALLLGVVLLFGLLGSNAVENMHRLGIRPGFDFLGRSANFEIGESLIAYTASDSYGRAILVGLLNTLLVASLGCVLATVLGVTLGIARLSSNPLLSGSVQAYVELVRNTPLLLQLFFWSATLHALPPPRQAFQPVGGVFLSNRGLFLPWFEPAGQVLLPIAFGLVAAWAILRTARRHAHPLSRHPALVLVAAIGLPPLLALVLGGGRLAADLPELRGFNITGGLTLSPEFAALLIGLVVNAAAGIAEIVRGGLEAVPDGQWEAGRALGLPNGRILRLIVLPQALRVITPALTSSYLSLTKNSSLAVAIGFPDLVSVVNTTANQSGQAFEALGIMVAVYLAISLAVSAAMNVYNARVALVGTTR